jgi:serine phosphatase RsbU (regulator of sigma subunit)
VIAGGIEAPSRLLVVDDNEMNRDMLARRLQKQGYTVEMAEDGRQALALLQGSAFDLVLLDIMMPEMDGYEVLERLKGDETLRHIPVVMISAVGETDSVARCIEMGADDYLPKPFNPIVLRARVTASLDKKKLRDRERLYAASLEREMQIGRDIQLGFLPEELPRIDGWEIAARFRPARSVAGDFYDSFMLANGDLVVIVADVCDKGVGAALYMALFRTLLRAVATEQPAGAASADVLRRAATITNDYIATTHSRSNMFATAFIGAIAPESGLMTYVNAGHEAPMVIGAQVRRLPPTAAALGLMPGMPFEPQTTMLAAGERLFVFTDGVTEAKGEAGFYGEERLVPLLAAPGAAALLTAVEESVVAFAGAFEPSDDVTMLAVARS